MKRLSSQENEGKGLRTFQAGKCFKGEINQMSIFAAQYNGSMIRKRRRYVRPEVIRIELDNSISLVMMTSAPPNPPPRRRQGAESEPSEFSVFPVKHLLPVHFGEIFDGFVDQAPDHERGFWFWSQAFDISEVILSRAAPLESVAVFIGEDGRGAVNPFCSGCHSP